jgi:hypothetical protein
VAVIANGTTDRDQIRCTFLRICRLDSPMTLLLFRAAQDR